MNFFDRVDQCKKLHPESAKPDQAPDTSVDVAMNMLRRNRDASEVPAEARQAKPVQTQVNRDLLPAG